MNAVLPELLGKVCFVYINYIVTYSLDLTTHIRIQQVFMCQGQIEILSMYNVYEYVKDNRRH